VVNNQAKLVIRQLGHNMDRHNIHPRKESVKCIGKSIGLHFLFMLRKHEFSLTIISWWVLQLIVGGGVSILQLSPRPKTFMQAGDDRLHKGLVWVLFKKLSELLDIDITYNFE
jgi:hypothetical protein